MFRSAANPVLRLVLAPSILLFYLSAHGAILPILAPIFVVIFFNDHAIKTSRRYAD